MKILPLGANLFHADGRHHEANSCFSEVCQMHLKIVGDTWRWELTPLLCTNQWELVAVVRVVFFNWIKEDAQGEGRAFSISFHYSCNNFSAPTFLLYFIFPFC